MGRLEDKIKQYDCIAIDKNSFIYLMERNPIFFNVVRELFSSIESGTVYAVSSILLMTEVLTKPLRERDKVLVNRYMAFIGTFPNLELKEVNNKIAFKAAKLRAAYGLKTPDAIFIATAIQEKAKLFVTNDVRLQKVEGVETLLLNDYLD